MKIALVGKGGSGKTTLSALLARHLAGTGAPTLAIDADINQHLAVALGATEDEAARLPALGDRLTEIKEYLRGSNPRIASADAMIKTTPPGRGSALLRVAASPLHDTLVRRIGGVPLAVTGAYGADEVGVACYHAKTGAVELLLNHLVDGPDEYVVVDMTAGADAFASGLFTRFDQTYVVCEPTLRGVGVYQQYAGYARDFGVRLAAVGNKVTDAADAAFLRERLGTDLAAVFGRSDYVRAGERGAYGPLEDLEPANREVLESLRTRLDALVRDWAEYTRQATAFHLRNAASWGNERTGTDLATQIDPEFVLGPHALAEAVS